MQPDARRSSTQNATSRVALFPWGGVIEDFLAPLGISPAQFAQQMSGGWLFGYIEALARQSVATTIVAFSSGCDVPTRLVNPETGVPTVLLPASPLYRWLRRWPGDIDDPHHPPIRRRLRHLQHLVRYFATRRQLVADTLKAEGCTAVLVQEYGNPRFDVLTRVGRSLGVPVFATFQGGPAPESRIEQAIRRRTIPLAAGFIVGSSLEAERVKRAHGIADTRVVAIPNPIDLECWRVEPRAECRAHLGIPERATVLISHGRIDVDHKGLDVLIEAWRRVTARRPNEDWRLHLVGSGKDDEVLARMVADAPIRGLRWVRRYINDRSEMRRELCAADMYVLASRREGFAVAPLEAMGCGLPVVASAVAGVADIFPAGESDGGLIVAIADVDELAHGLEQLLLDTGRRSQMAQRARQRVEEYCSLDAVGRRLADVLAPDRTSGLVTPRRQSR